jgi:hypothetical protein
VGSVTGPADGEVDQLRQRVAQLEHQRLVDLARRVAPGVELPADATTSEVHARVVSHLYGPGEIDGASEDTLKGYFTALVHLHGADPAGRPRTPPRDARH